MVLADTTHRPELFARRPGMHRCSNSTRRRPKATRRRVLDEVATDRVQVIGYHFPFPAAGHIARDGEGYRYVRADWS